MDHNAKEQFKRSHRYKDLLKILQDSKPLQRADEDSISYYEFRRRVKEFMGVQVCLLFTGVDIFERGYGFSPVFGTCSL